MDAEEVLEKVTTYDAQLKEIYSDLRRVVSKHLGIGKTSPTVVLMSLILTADNFLHAFEAQQLQEGKKLRAHASMLLLTSLKESGDKNADNLSKFYSDLINKKGQIDG